MEEIWININYVDLIVCEKFWTDYYIDLESILGCEVTKMDTNDPLKRKVDRNKINDIGKYIINFDTNYDYRWIFSYFKDIKLSITHHHHNTLRSGIRAFQNSLKFYFPPEFCCKAENVSKIQNIFLFTVEKIAPFYAYSDILSAIKKRKSPAVPLIYKKN